MKLKHVLTAAMIAWASLDVQGQQVVKHTQEELCEITKKSMIKGWKYLDNYNPGFKPALEQLGFSTTEKDSIFTSMCRKTDEVYYAMDQTAYTIMQNNKLNPQDKKSLIQRLVLGTSWLLLPAHLNGERSKYHTEFVERVKRAYNPDNRAKVIAYIKEENAKAKEANAKAKEEQRIISEDLKLINGITTMPK